MESLKYLRSSFKHQVENGALRRPQIHVEFSHPKGCEEFCCCVTTGRLRLTNISAVFWKDFERKVFANTLAYTFSCTYLIVSLPKTLQTFYLSSLDWPTSLSCSLSLLSYFSSTSTQNISCQKTSPGSTTTLQTETVHHGLKSFGEQMIHPLSHRTAFENSATWRFLLCRLFLSCQEGFFNVE